MLGRVGFPAALALLAGLLAMAAACSDDGGGDVTAEATPTASDTTPAPDIRGEDLAGQAGLATFLTEAGGVLDPERIIYQDLTEDGVDEAVAPVSSGGEGGDIAVFVYGYVSGTLTELLSLRPEDQTFAVAVEDGALSVTQPRYEAGDPLCCPSSLLIETYTWDGASLTLSGELQIEEGTPSKAGDE